MTELSAYQQLAQHHARLSRLNYFSQLSAWDQRTHMPPAGAATKARAHAELASLLHALAADPGMDALLARANDEPLDDWQQANIKEMQRRRALSRALPADLISRHQIAVGTCNAAWMPARRNNDWASFAVALKPVVAVLREEALGQGQALGVSRYDALLQRFERGTTTARLRGLFAQVSAWLPDLVTRVLACQRDDVVMDPTGPFPVTEQAALCRKLMSAVGLDPASARLDTSAHPFATSGSPQDVRLTNRYDEAAVMPALRILMHEAGHGSYRHGSPAEWAEQPLGEPASAAMDEGQALFFERHIGMRPAFSAWLAPQLRAAFGDQSAFDADNLARLALRVQPGKLRTAADELTYPAHVILRFEIERALIESEIEVDDIPACWDEHMQRLLGIDTRGDYRDGPLQDMHWPDGGFGYFPSYLLGAMTAAQLADAAERDIGNLDGPIGQGDFAPVTGWLGRQVWSQASRFEPDELLQRCTGATLDPQFLRQHLEQRYLGVTPPATSSKPRHS
jgi:carboxypeptidase Taq